MTGFDINVSPATEPTELCEIMQRYSGDKGSVHGNARHNYTRLYQRLFEPRRLEPLRVFELGIFCGASLRAWRDFFPNAAIIGMDIDPGTMIRGEERIATIQCDERDKVNVERWFASMEPFDIIIDDGLHNLDDNVKFHEIAWPHLKSGGLYVIEDLVDVIAYADEWLCDGSDPNFERIVQLKHHEDTSDNALLVMRKA